VLISPVTNPLQTPFVTGFNEWVHTGQLTIRADTFLTPSDGQSASGMSRGTPAGAFCDKVVTRFEWTGTHKAAFFCVPATGRPVRVWGVVIDRLEGGKIKDTRLIMDALGLMMQLGAFPPPHR
jgi:hypothetical protein